MVPVDGAFTLPSKLRFHFNRLLSGQVEAPHHYNFMRRHMAFGRKSPASKLLGGWTLQAVPLVDIFQRIRPSPRGTALCLCAGRNRTRRGALTVYRNM